MNIHIVSIFPEVYDSFLSTSLIEKAIQNNILNFTFTDPRSFCLDKHRQVDDEIYWVWAGMLLKAQPFIDAVNSVVENYITSDNFKVLYLAPSKNIFDQNKAYEFSKIDDIIFVCWRYEWIDYRFEKYFKENIWEKYQRISLWNFVTMWGELPSMTMIEAITRLVPGVIKEELSWQEESYSPEKSMKNIEYPQYTRPKEVYGMEVPQVLLSWNHKEIEKRKEENENIE